MDVRSLSRRGSFLAAAPFLLVTAAATCLANEAGEAPEAAPVEAAAGAPAAAVADTVEPSRRLRIRAVGDVMLGTDFPSVRFLPPDDGVGSLSAVRDLLLDADLTFMNLEGPLLDGGSTSKCAPGSTSCYAFRTPTRYAHYLDEVDLDLASLANNHAQDFESANPALDGRTVTRRLLDSLGIHWSGPAGTFASLERNGLRIAFVAYHTADHSNYVNDEAGAARFIRRLAADHDVVIVSFHGGAEGGVLHVPRGREIFLGEDRGNLRLFARTVIDAGADLVIGHGPHIPRGIEVYHGRLVAYSLGNFATYGRFNLDGERGMAPILEVELDETGAFTAGRILSARQVGEGIPEPDERGAAAELMSRLSDADFLDSEASVLPDGTIRLRVSAGVTE